MKPKFRLSILLCLLALASNAQEAEFIPSVNIGDTAPLIRLNKWIKGTRIDKFEKGLVYVIEFWATWCQPCKAAMPHLSALADKYKNSVRVLGIDIYESNSTSIEKIKKFVDSMGQKMNYSVAIEDSNFMETQWILATGSKNQGIPSTFVVDREGRLAWIGHPKDLEKILPKVINNTWNAKEELRKKVLAKELNKLNDSLYNHVFWKYKGDILKSGDLGRPDSALFVINKIIETEPGLSYAPVIVYNTFSALLIINQHKALNYGRVVIKTPNYNDDLAYHQIIGAIESYADKLNLSAEIYQLGAEACQAGINDIPYPEIVDMYKRYHKMAGWYWLANNKLKAIDAEKEAIISLKSKSEFSKTTLAEYEAILHKYTKGNSN